MSGSAYMRLKPADFVYRGTGYQLLQIFWKVT